MDLAAITELLSQTGTELMRTIEQSTQEPLALGTQLRNRYSAELVAAAMTQVQLRGKAVAKFGARAHQMWFTPESLQQATRATVARYRAQRVLEGGFTHVTDLGCGIGSDLIAFCDAGLQAHGVEIDPLRAELARANVAALRLHAQVTRGTAEETTLDSNQAVFCDPARRNANGRIFDIDQMSPSWDFVSGLLDGPAIVKTLPGIDHHRIPAQVEAEWISQDGNLLEACLWGPGLAGTTKKATVINTKTGAISSLTEAHAPVDITDVHAWIGEPDDAVIRAGLVADLAATLGSTLMDQKLAYLTASAAPASPFIRWFRVVQELPFGQKPLRAALTRHDIGTLTIKKRGIDIQPEQLVKRLRLNGSRSATVILARIGTGARAFLVEPPDGAQAPDDQATHPGRVQA